MDYTDTTLNEIARTRARKAGVRLANPLPDPSLRAGPIIAEFASARDAQLFCGMKRDDGAQVTVTAGVNLLYAVRTLVGKL